MSLRTGVVIGLVLVASAGPALAADHVMRVGEVLLSKNASATSQYIELEDFLGEPFPNPPYSIEIFNAAGTSIGSQTLTVPAGTTRFLVATAQAATDFSVTAQATLTVVLPTSGQVCFKNVSARIHCFGWGTITSSVIGNVNDTGPSPQDGMSVQRTTGTPTYQIGPPTPGAANFTPATPDGSIVIDAQGPRDGGTDAPTGNPNNPSDSGCGVGGGASWLALIGLGGLVLLRRSAARRRAS